MSTGLIFKRASIVLFVVLCFGFSQFAGWAVMGTILADNQVRRSDAALKGDLVRGDLRTAAADYQSLAGTPAVGEAQAEIDKLLAVYVKAGKGTVGALTENCAKPDWAPATCRKVADARGVLEKAKRRDALKAQIDAGGARIDGAEKVADGAVEVAVPVGIAQRLGFVADGEEGKHAAEDTARFFRVVFLVAFVGLVATFGFALVGVRHTDIKKGSALLRESPMAIVPLIFLLVEGGMNAIFGWRQAGGGFFSVASWLQAAMFFSAAVLGAYLPTRWHAAHEPTDAEKYPDLSKWDFGPARLGGPSPQAATRDFAPEANPLPSAHAQGFPAAHGSAGFAAQPININFGLPGAASLVAPGGETRPASGPQDAPSASAPAVAATPAPAGPQPEQLALPARGVPDRPVDRSAYERDKFVQEQVDALMTFRAACVLDAPGGAVEDQVLYDRYWHWCGGAGLPRRDFDALFAKATGLRLYSVGSGVVWGNVVLRDTVQLRRA
jgi:hypothetical protein